MNRRRRVGASRHRSGLSLPEVLIAVAISAMLLTAVAFALDASFKSYRVNQEQSTLTQRARLAMYRLLTAIRMSDAHAPATVTLYDEFATGQLIDDTGIAMFNDANQEVVYKLDAVNHRLLMSINGASRTLLEGVTAFRVTLEPMRSPAAIRTGGSFDLLHRATILLSVHSASSNMMSSETTNAQTITLSSSVVPRRNVW